MKWYINYISVEEEYYYSKNKIKGIYTNVVYL